MNKEILPFLKWAGGKRWLLKKHPDIFPTNYNIYYEPFLGSGVSFFKLNPKRSVLNDLNHDLYEAYLGIKNNPEKVEQLLQLHHENHSLEYYYHIRSKKYESLEERAARMIYLNRTCFNGIYRVNLRGEFNVPKGTKEKVLLDSDDFHGVSKRLQKVKLLNRDFEEIIDLAKKKDFIFVDPPYTVRHNQNGFIKYNEILFKWEDQVRLANSLYRAKERGVKILLTNASHQSIRELYEERNFLIKPVSRYSSISAKGEGRNKFEELLISCNIGDDKDE